MSLISVEKMNDLTTDITFNQSGFSLIDLEDDYSSPSVALWPLNP